MKTAYYENGRPIEANAMAPMTASCPHCGGSVTLRCRKGVGGDPPTYFWRHSRLIDRQCPSSFAPFRIEPIRRA